MLDHVVRRAKKLSFGKGKKVRNRKRSDKWERK